MTMQNEKITVALNKLDRDPLNVRKTYTKEGIEELAANIRADGYRLLQDPVVRKGDKKGRYYVTAGARRLAALQHLAEKGEIEAGFVVSCTLRDEQDAVSISLAENLLREGMNPVDQYEAFRTMIEKGMPLADVAVRFSVMEAIVRQRMALAKVSPVLLEHWGLGCYRYF